MKHVLVVEDDYGSREMLKLILAEKYRVTDCLCAEDAQEVLDAEPVDLVLLDIHLLGRTGLALLEHIRGRGAAVPVVLISSQTDQFALAEAKRLGAAGFLGKPYRRARLLQYVEVLTADVGRKPAAR